MHPIFSSADYPSEVGSERWQELVSSQMIPLDVTPLSDSPFQAKLEIAARGSLHFARVTQSAVRVETHPMADPHHAKADTLAVIIQGYGVTTTVQDGREAVQRPGDLLVLDRRPSVSTKPTASRCLIIEMPRTCLQSALGSTHRYAGLTVRADLASTKLATNFIQQFIQIGSQLPPTSATRMASIAVDLVAASLAERLAQEVPRPLQGTIAVQQAKAYIEANIGDRSLDPAQVAAAAGLSLRRLQELFAERGRNISDYIWFRRLETVTKRLVDPGCAHLPIGAIALSCGFADAAHFSKRFKALHGMTASEYRITHMQDRC